MATRAIPIEGLNPDEILAMTDEEIGGLVFVDRPLVFRVGTAEILGQFRIVDKRLVVELAQIDGGGEGVLPTIWRVAERYTRKKGLGAVEWIVHAVNCAKPNLKLRRVLERRGFIVEEVPGTGIAYHLVTHVEIKEQSG